MSEPMPETTIESFAALAAAVGFPAPPARRYGQLVTAYGAPSRKYHTLTHVGWVLRRIDEMAAEDKTRGSVHNETEWNRIRWAAWFHDFVLNGSPEDEAESAAEAMFLLEFQPAEEMKRLVLATGHDRVPLRHDEAILCDADLSILGADETAFDRYEQLVREEWAHVPDLLFATARTTILRRFIDKPWIYMTDYGRTRWERKARANLNRSVAQLAALAEKP